MIVPGIVALACVILTGALLVLFGSPTPLAPEGYRVTVPIAQAANLLPGSAVEISGVRVGRVVSMSTGPSSAYVTLELEARFAPLRAGAVAIARTKTLLGEGYVAIAPGPPSAPLIPDGGRLPPNHVRPTVQLDQFLSAFDTATRQRFRDLVLGLASALRGRDGQLSDSLGHAAPLTTNLAEVMNLLDAQREDLQGLISSGAGIAAAVGKREGSLEAAVTAGDRLLAQVAARRRALSATIAALPGFLDQLRHTSAQLVGASANLNDALGALAGIAPRVAPALSALYTAAPELRGLFLDLPATIAAGREGLPALDAISASARLGFDRFYPTARELIPLMRLFAVERLAPLIFANTDSVAAGSYVGADGVPRPYGSGIVTVWNEAIAGWTKRLPTNRQNPYPKSPRALLDTGRIGVLKSFDCRNVHNPDYLPPTGTGAPPCILQGPWRFDGRMAYYPRLRRAGP
jgi:virulence factor Mce-like protein